MSADQCRVHVTCGAIAFDAPTIRDERGVRRFVAGLARHLSDSGQVDLNRLAMDHTLGHFGLEDYMRFYVGLGYSISGFYEIFPEADVQDIEEGRENPPP